MFKKLLMSGLVLGALAATVGGATYAPWTDEATGTGTITAATIDVQVNGEVSDSFTFTLTPANLLPGETANGGFSVANAGNRDVNLVYSAVASGGTGACPAGWLTPVSASGPASLAPGASAGGSVAATLHADAPIDCMGVTFTVTVTVTGTGV